MVTMVCPGHWKIAVGWYGSDGVAQATFMCRKIYVSQDLCVAKEKEGEGEGPTERTGERVWVWVWTAKAYGEVSFFFAGKNQPASR
jgi:hypothetical protein